MHGFSSRDQIGMHVVWVWHRAWCRTCLSTTCMAAVALQCVYCSFMLSACYNQQTCKVPHVFFATPSFKKRPQYHHTMFAIHHTQLYYMMVYHTRYMNYSVNVFLRLNWNRTVLVFLSSICSVTMLLDLVQTDHNPFL